MCSLKPFLALVVAMLIPALYADVEPVGILSYDVLNPSDGISPGVDGFDISNFTGDPSAAGLALPPDFPVLTSLTLLNSTLTLFNGASSQVVNLGDIAPGFLSDPSLQFLDGTPFTSAVFSATLGTTTLSISGNTQDFLADSPTLTATLLPSAGTDLTAGADFAILGISGSFQAPSSVPEPSTGTLFITVAFVAGSLLRKRSHS